MNDNGITLGDLLTVLESSKPITINLFDQDNLLLITFIKDGFQALEDVLESDSVTKIVIKNLQTIDITINTEGN